jgi:hypothetical protein
MSVGKKINTNLSQFTKELNDLIQKIRSMRSHFIRCIKPNTSLSPQVFQPDMILLQLRCGGTLQAIQIYQDSFPQRMSFQYFLSRYSVFLCLCGINFVTKEVNELVTQAHLTGQLCYWRAGVLKLIDIICLTMKILDMMEEAASSPPLPSASISPKVLGITEELLQQGLQVGKTSVFLRTNIFEYLENVQLHCVTMIAKKLQRKWRAYQFLKSIHRPHTSPSPPTHSSSSSSSSLTLSLLSFNSDDFKLKRFQRTLFASVIIQRSYRLHSALKYKALSLSRIRHLQALYRGYRARKCVKQLKFKSACFIQTLFRKYVQIVLYQKKILGLRVLQKNCQIFVGRLWKRKALRGIALLQRVERGRQSRSRTRVLAAAQVLTSSFSYRSLDS